MSRIDQLREMLMQDCYGAFFGGGYGGALMESMDIENASEEELIQIARSKGIELDDFDDEVDDDTEDED